MDTATVLWEMEQIRQLKARYFRLLDTKDWAGFRELFADDLVCAIETYPGRPDDTPTTKGADAFVARVAASHATSVTVHHGHMPEIEITGERTARGIWAMYDWVDSPDTGRHFQGYGHYHEEYEKGADGRWRIGSLRLTRLRMDPTR